MSREKGRYTKRWTDEEKNLFKELWMSGRKMTEICATLGVNCSTMYGQVARWQEDGFIPKGLRKNRDLNFVGNRTNHPKKAKPKEEKPKNEKPKTFKPRKYKGEVVEEKFIKDKTPIPTNDEPIKCTKAVGQTCAFGNGECVNYNCDFLTITGKRRGCSANACVHYLPVSETQPKYVLDFAMRGNQSDLFVRKENNE